MSRDLMGLWASLIISTNYTAHDHGVIALMWGVLAGFFLWRDLKEPA